MTTDGSTNVTDRLVHVWQSFASRMDRLPLATFAVVVVFLALFRSGLRFNPSPDPTDIPDAPWAAGLRDTWLLLLKALGVSTRLQAEILGLLLLTIAVVVIVMTAGSFKPTIAKWVVVGVFLGPMGTTLFIIGSHYTFLVVGAVVFVLGGARRPWTLIVGSLLLVAGNLMQSFATAIMLFLIALVPEFNRWRLPSIVLGIVSSSALAFEALLASRYPVATQIGDFPGLLGRSLEAFATTAPHLVYSLYGVNWIVVFIVLLGVGRLRAAWLALPLFVFPLALVASTFDGSRVAAGLTATQSLVLLVWLVEQLREKNSGRLAMLCLPAFFVVGVITPAIDAFGGGVNAPWFYLWFSANFWIDVMQESVF